MQPLGRFAMWVRAVFRRAQVDRGLEKEIRLHLEMETERNIRLGVPPEEAARRARVAFGSVEVSKEAARDERGTRWLEELWQDARLTLRGMRRAPGFAAIVLATLAIGIGANTAVFSVLRRVLLDRLPYRAPNELLLLYGANAKAPDDLGWLTPAEIVAIERDAKTLSAVSPMGSYGGGTFVGDRTTESWASAMAGPDFFRTLGTPALLGRTIDARDLEHGADHVVVLSHATWQRSFGGDPGVIGRRVLFNDTSYAVIGVMPPNFVPPERAPEVWVPLDLRPMTAGHAANSRYFHAVARLAAGASAEQARAELRVIVRNTDRGTPLEQQLRAVNPVLVREALVGKARPVLLVLMAAAALVLLAACVNVAGLFLARAIARRRELAVRAALGAGRWRLARHTLTEAATLSTIGGALGILLAFWGCRAIVTLGAPLLPPLGDGVRLDAGVLTFALVLALLCGLAVGMVPALASARSAVRERLAESTRSATGGRQGTRLSRLLVAGQVAMAVTLLVGAGLLGRALAALEQTGVGYRTDQSVLAFGVNASMRKYATRPQQAQFMSALLGRIRSLPGVESAAATGIAAWNGWYSDSVLVERGAPGQVGALPEASYTWASNDLFATLGMPLVHGRDFSAVDGPNTPAVAIVSERLARQARASGDVLGMRIRLSSDTTWREIIGVVGDVRESPNGPVESTVYLCACQTARLGGQVLVRAARHGDAMALVPALRRELRALDPTIPLAYPLTLADVFGRSVAGQRLPLAFLGAFAALSLLLATLGVYGVLAYAVTARSREFGIRLALGSGRRGLVWVVLRQGLTIAAAGAAVGLVAAVLGARAIAGLLYGVTAHDPLTFALAPAVLVAASALACLIPARRATRVDPTSALRAD